jgi:hypothetical protein
MATTKKLQVTELDFDNIKNNFKTFLKGQSEFSDYDLEGSGMNVLMDLLAYNTHYLAYNLNMAVNESFLNRASLRSSVISHAKTLGYTPRSSRSPVAYINIVVNDLNISQAVLEKGTLFTTTVDEVEYTFVTISDYTAVRTLGVLEFLNIPIYEGTLVTTQYTVDTSNAEQRFLILSNKVDTETLKVTVQNSSSDTTTNSYILSKSISNIDSNSKIYFLNEVEDQTYEIFFGDGTFGSSIQNGNIVNMDYIVTNEDAANKASIFSIQGNISGTNDITITTVSEALGGDVAESIDSIKRYAPLYLSTQNRAVTVNDYKTIIPKIYTNTSSIKVWGGEDNEIPNYGRVYIAIKPYSANSLTETQKNQLINLLKPYTIASTSQIIVDPEIVSLFMKVRFKYDEVGSTKTPDDISTLIKNSIKNYAVTDLEKFDSFLRYTNLTNIINSSDSFITSSSVKFNMSKSFTPIISAEKQYVINFYNPIFNPHTGHESIITSTKFTIEGYTQNFYIDDDGAGNLRLYYILNDQKIYINNNLGTVDYSSGKIIINSLIVTSTSNTDGSIRLIAVPNDTDIYSVRQQILTVDMLNIEVTGISDLLVNTVSENPLGLFSSFNITKQDSFIEV